MDFNTPAALWSIFFLTIATSFFVPYFFVKYWLADKIKNFSRDYKLPACDDLLKLTGTDGLKNNGAVLASEICKRGNTSLAVVGEFTEYHYFALIGAIVPAVLVGAAAFLVADGGWSNANAALRGMFLGSASALALWLTMIQVFRYSDTIAKHESIYTLCANLLSDLVAVLSCPPKLGRNGKEFYLEAYLQGVLGSKLG